MGRLTTRSIGKTRCRSPMSHGDTMSAANFVPLFCPVKEASETMNVILMMTTVPDTTIAEKLATEVLAARLAACATQLGAVRSSFHWQGKIESAGRGPLVCTARAAARRGVA